MALPLGIAILFLFVSFFEMIDKDPSLLNTSFKITAYLILALHFIQTLWHNYYVSYNKKAITIRLSRNILKERSFQFKYLKEVNKEGHIISLNYRNKKEQIDLNGFDEESQESLFNILNNI